MKKIVFLLLFFVATMCNAQILEKNEAGEYRIAAEKNDVKLASTGILVTSGAERYAQFFSEAIDNPGTPILVQESVELIRLKPIFKKLEEVKKREIVYDNSKKTISLIKSREERESSSYVAIFSILSLILMAISNILFKNGNLSVSAVAWFVSLIAAVFFIILMPIENPAVIVIIFAVFSGSFAKNSKEFFLIPLTLYYLLMIIHFVLLYV